MSGFFGVCGVRLGWYVIVGVVVALAVVAFLMLHNAHEASVQYVGSPNGYEGFVPSGQTVNYDGNIDPTGDLILNNGTTIHNTVWDGQYAGTIIQNHDQIVQLNNQFVGQTDPVNHQPYVNLQDFYVIKGQVPIYHMCRILQCLLGLYYLLLSRNMVVHLLLLVELVLDP